MNKFYIAGAPASYDTLIAAILAACVIKRYTLVVHPSGQISLNDTAGSWDFYHFMGVMKFLDIQELPDWYVQMPETCTIGRKALLQAVQVIAKSCIPYAKIEAIKLLRGGTDLGLKECKDFLENTDFLEAHINQF